VTIAKAAKVHTTVRIEEARPWWLMVMKPSTLKSTPADCISPPKRKEERRRREEKGEGKEGCLCVCERERKGLREYIMLVNTWYSSSSSSSSSSSYCYYDTTTTTPNSSTSPTTHMVPPIRLRLNTFPITAVNNRENREVRLLPHRLQTAHTN